MGERLMEAVISWFCGLGWHEWTRWKTVDGFYYRAFSDKPVQASIQYRNCKRCGFRQLRDL